MKSDSAKFSHKQFLILAGMIVAYTGAYVCRLNLSAALGGIVTNMSISNRLAGMLPTAFAVVYAAGQFINGAIVNRVHPVRHILTGLAGTSIVNIMMCIVGKFLTGISGFLSMFALCILNGAFQSMLWTPIVRLIALEYTTEPLRKRVNFLLAFTMTAGHFLAWFISWLMSTASEWTFSFLIPGLLLIPVIFIVRALLKSVRDVGSIEKVPHRGMHTDNPVAILWATSFPLILIGCIMHGFVRDGINNWAPTILSSISTNSMVFSLVIPFINAVGILIGHKLVSKPGNKPRSVCAVLFAACSILCLLLVPFCSHPWFLALFMGLTCACMYGMNPLMTTLIPLEYDKFHLSALTAGMVDSFIYIGSALSGVIGGGMLASSKSLFFVGIALASLAGAVFMFFSAKKSQN